MTQCILRKLRIFKKPAMLAAALVVVNLSWSVCPQPSAFAGETRLDARPDSNQRVARPVPAKVVRYAQRVVRKYDEDGNGQLGKNEWQQMRGNPQSADFDADGTITVEEFADHVARYGRRRHIRLVLPELSRPTDDPVSADESDPPTAEPSADSAEESETGEKSDQPRRHRDAKFFVPASRLPKSLPGWFHTRDRNGDGQLTLAEFAPKASRPAAREFTRYDLNRDGLLTPKEYLQVAAGKAKPVEVPEKEDAAP